jgi:CheY-like chemotaxis protein
MSKRILVIDDSPTIRKVVNSILERAGYEARAAADGQQGLEALSNGEKFDLVLLDFVMPRMNGYRFCRAIRANEKLRSSPIVLMSAKSERIREQFVQQTGAVDAITKPFDARALIAVIENALARLEQGTARVGTTFEDDEPPSLPKASPDKLNSSLAGNVILSGDLSLPIGAILQMLQVERQTGLLEVTRPLASRSEASFVRAWQSMAQSHPLPAGCEVLITWRDGLVDFVRSRGTGDEFRLGRFFVEEGLVTPAEIDALLLRRDSDPPQAESRGTARRLLGDMLLEARRVSEDQLRIALVRQASELIYELLRWKKGRFEFRRQAPSARAVRARLSLPVASVVMEGFRRVDEWRAVEAGLGSFESVLQRDPMAIEALGVERLSPPERLLLDSIDGERTVREMISASHMSSFDACRILTQLLEARVVRRRAGSE